MAQAPMEPAAVAAAETGGDGAGEKGGMDAANAVSQLQEYVQSCSSFSPHTRILTWSFEQQLENETLLQFRATVSFMFNSIPHYFCGGWQSSKKKAQRDTAERVKQYLAKTFDGADRGAGEANRSGDAQAAKSTSSSQAAELPRQADDLCDDFLEGQA